MHIIGFDAGNSETTLAWRSGAATRHVTAPSFIGTGRIERVQRIRSGVESDGLQKDEIVLHYDGMAHFIGRLAIEESRDASAARNDVGRYWNGHTLRLLLALAAQANISGPVRLVTGLPVSAWTAENKRLVQHSLIGEYCYAVNGKERRLAIEAVGVMMEGAAALAGYEAAPDLPQAVIDVGGRTTDLFWAQGVRPIAQRCSAEEIGVERAGDLLREGILETHQRDLRPQEVRDQLHGYITGKPSRVFHNGKELVLNGAVTSAVETVGRQLVSYVARQWGDDRGAVASEAARILLIGGGAYYFADVLKAAIPHLETARAPELANALGYLSVGQAASEEAWARNRG
jgi:actin-like protein/actin family MreB-like protein